MVVVLLVVVALLLGALTRYLLRRTSVPYTVVLLLIGVGFGAVGDFGHIVEMISGFPPDSSSKGLVPISERGDEP